MTAAGHEAPVPMALDDVQLAESGGDAAPTPVDLGTLEAASDAPAPTALGLIGGASEAPPAPDPNLGGELGAVAEETDAAPAPTMFTEGGAVAEVSDEPPAPMSLEQLENLQRG